MSDLVTRDAEKALETLDGVKKRTLELKYRGYNANRIVEILAEEKYEVPKLSTIHSWFEKGGPLYKHYETYKMIENEYRRDEAHLIFKRNIANAAKTMVKKLRSRNERVALEAAKEIVDREMGKATENIKTEFTGKIAFLDLMKEVENERRQTKIIDVPAEDSK